MKKTTIFLLGALIASVLPGGGLKAQTNDASKQVYITVKTIDRAPLTSARFYGASSTSDMLYIDADHINPDYSGASSATSVSSLYIHPLSPANIQSGNMVSATVDTTNLVNAVFVAEDANGRLYVWGNSTFDLIDSGFFQAANIFRGVDTVRHELDYNFMIGHKADSNATIAKDNENYYYTTLGKALDTNFHATRVTLFGVSPATGTPDSIRAGLSFVLDTNAAIMGTLCIASNDEVTITGAPHSAINFLQTSNADTGRVRIFSVDSIGYLSASASHPVEIRDSRVRLISPANPVGGDTAITIYSGKYGNMYNAYLAPGCFFITNPDADRNAFKFKVANGGFQVVFNNFNARGGDSIIACNGGLIVPAPTRPAYIGADTTFGHYWKDAAFTEPWHFDTDSINSNDTLYAKWYIFDAANDYRYIVNHHAVSYDFADTTMLMSDTLTVAQTEASSVALLDAAPMGYLLDGTAPTVAIVSNDTVFDLYYIQQRYVITFDIRYPDVVYDSTYALVDTLGYGDTITYPVVFGYPGSRHAGWLPAPVVMPARDIIVQAAYANNRYNVIFSGENSFVYNQQNRVFDIEVEAVVSRPEFDSLPAPLDRNSFIIRNAAGDTVPAADTVGTYTIKAVASIPYVRNDVLDRYEGYYLTGDTIFTIEIVPASLTVVAPQVEKVKVYDGTRSANVLSYGNLQTFYSGDDVRIDTTNSYALYTDASAADNKVITLYLAGLEGNDAHNYVLDTNVVVVCYDGVIIAPIAIDEEEFINGFDIDASGICEGENRISFELTSASGMPDEYMLDYSDAANEKGFADVAWTAIPETKKIDIVVPEGFLPGDYTVNIMFRYRDYPQFPSQEFPLDFKVNLPSQLIRPIFEDVISIIDTNKDFRVKQNSIKWYHNGEEVTEYNGQAYCREEGGLTGEYRAEFDYYLGDSEEVSGHDITCVQTNLATSNIIVEGEATVSIYPNPTVDVVNISLENAHQFTHSVRVMNIMGVVLYEGSFEGNETRLDFSTFGNGSYTVSVDGVVVRVIKK